MCGPPALCPLRQQHNASIYQIQALLEKEGHRASLGYIQKVFDAAGIARLPEARSVRALVAVKADRRKLDLSPRTFHTDFAGLFLFAFDLARMKLGEMLGAFPGTTMIPASCAVRSLLALKLWSIGRPSQVMAETLDEGLALFAGLNVIPKRTALTAYSVRVDPKFAGALMHRWYHAAKRLAPGLHGGRSFDLDFHT